MRAGQNINIVDHALAAAEQGLLVFPLKPLDKHPAHRGWQSEASADPAVIARMFAGNPRANYGVRTGLENNLVVIDLDGPGAQAWWSGLGIQSTASVATPSGPDRTHHYFRIYDVEIANSQSAIHPGVDVRGTGGYVVGPGSMLPTGTYRGDIRNIPDAPPELLALIPEKQTYQNVEATDVGDKVTDPTDSEIAQIADQVKRLEALPLVWHEGAGWHSAVFRACCHFSRMVNSKHYAMTEDGALTILLSSTPTYPDWDTDKILEQWASARKTTLGQAADIPTAAMPALLPILDVLNLPNVPSLSSTGAIFTDLVFGEPDVKTAGSFWKRRSIILQDCFRAGFTPEQAATVGWNSKVSAELQSDPAGLRKLWGEVEKARLAVLAETGASFEAAAPEDHAPASTTRERIDLLTEDERALIADVEWFGSRYLDWAETRVSMMNEPYHRMNVFLILSLVFSEFGYIPALKGPINLALFMMILGKTTTGKTEALELAISVIRACFPGEDNPDIGGDASPNSLIEKLITRDGKPSWFNADEAHGLFLEMQGASWRAGLMQKWTKLYDGRVPMILRNGKKDISGINATTFFVMSLMGTVDGMTDVLDSEFWTSGFLARFVWAIGHEMERTPESFLELDQEGDVMRGYEEMPRQWAAEFEAAKQKLSSGVTLPLAIGMDDDARARHVAFKKTLDAMFRGHRQVELLKPTTIRFAISIRKCASLIAMSMGERKIRLQHELMALAQAEEWITNIVTMVEQTTATALMKKVDDVERYIGSLGGRQARIEKVYAHFHIKKQFMDDYISQLVAEARITKEQTTNGGTLLKLRDRETEMAA